MKIEASQGAPVRTPQNLGDGADRVGVLRLRRLVRERTGLLRSG